MYVRGPLKALKSPGGSVDLSHPHVRTETTAPPCGRRSCAPDSDTAGGGGRQ